MNQFFPIPGRKIIDLATLDLQLEALQRRNEERVSEMIKRMGKHYICHRDNRVGLGMKRQVIS